MLFLLNDAILDTDGVHLPPRLGARRLAALPFYSLTRLGQELFAEDPLLQLVRPERARRLAALIAAKAPAINAALFVAPGFDCPPGAVQARFANLGFTLIADLHRRQLQGGLDMLAADRKVWRRLAA